MTTRYYLAFSYNPTDILAANDAGHLYALATFAEPRIAHLLMQHHFGQPNMSNKGELIIDSGAFSAYSSGVKIDLCAYIDYIYNFKELHGNSLARLEYMNLDVIGDHDASLKNWEIMRAAGLSPMPVFTYQAPIEDLAAMAMQAGQRIALGGLVPLSRGNNRAALRSWLEACFSVLPPQAQVHLLGVGAFWVLRDFPIASCDSSTFTSGVRFNKPTRHNYEGLSNLVRRRRRIADDIYSIQKRLCALHERDMLRLF